MPKISIITVCYNAEKVIERTIKSVVNQSFEEIEYIIIDGDSEDNTTEVYKSYKGSIHKFVSEKDNGIYDAMNKGLKVATGDFVWFMNAGDEIPEKTTLSKIFSKVPSDADLIYGDSLFVNEYGKIRGLRSELTPHALKPKINWKDLKFGMLVCHQSLIVHRDIAADYMEDNLSADIDWEIKAFKAAKKTFYVDFPISKYLEGGISNQNLRKSLLDRFKVLKGHFGLIPTVFNHLLILGRGLKKIVSNRGKYW